MFQNCLKVIDKDPIKIRILNLSQSDGTEQKQSKNRAAVDKPGEELGDGARTEDLRLIAIRDSVDIRLNIFVGYDRHDVFERLAVGSSLEAVSFEVLNVSIA